MSERKAKRRTISLLDLKNFEDKEDKKRIERKKEIKSLLASQILIKRLVEIKDARGVRTNTEFANWLGCTKYEWQKMRVGKIGVSAIGLFYLIVYYNVNPAFIFAGEKPIFLDEVYNEVSNLKLKLYDLYETQGKI